MAAERGRDIMVIGASAGGVTAIRDLVMALPAELPAALFVVVHTAPRGESQLAPILDRAGPLEVAFAREGEAVRAGRIYVAPPDRHLILRDGHVHLTRSPKENRTRPAVNPLFRSAAAAYGERVVGVVLTGMLDNGTAGLLAVEAAGGVTVVQDPEDAEFPGMPLSALDYLEPDHLVPAAELPRLLTQLAGGVPAGWPGPGEDGSGRDGTRENRVREVAMTAPDEGAWQEREPNEASGFTCPECSGALWEVEEHGLLEYMCRIGHLFGPETLLEEQTSRRADLLEGALRSVREEAGFAELLLDRGRERGLEGRRLKRHEARVRELTELGDALAGLVRGGMVPREGAA